jgi:hypothetical protein
MEVAEIIRKATRRTVDVPVFLAGDMVAEYEALERQLVEAQRATADSLGGGPAVEIAQRMEDLRAAMAEWQITVTLCALSRLAYRQLLAAHPPRRDESGEVNRFDMAGFNSETFYPAILRACWSAPTLDEETRTHLLDEVLTDRQFDELAISAVNVNRGAVDIPFSRAASTILRNSESQ